MANEATSCELCSWQDVLVENALAYVRYDNNSLSRGHVLVVPKRHVASFFDMTAQEQAAVLALLGDIQKSIQKQYSPDGYNIGVFRRGLRRTELLRELLQGQCGRQVIAVRQRMYSCASSTWQTLTKQAAQH